MVDFMQSLLPRNPLRGGNVNSASVADIYKVFDCYTTVGLFSILLSSAVYGLRVNDFGCYIDDKLCYH